MLSQRGVDCVVACYNIIDKGVDVSRKALKLSIDNNNFPVFNAVVNGVVALDDVIDKCVDVELGRL